MKKRVQILTGKHEADEAHERSLVAEEKSRPSVASSASSPSCPPVKNPQKRSHRQARLDYWREVDEGKRPDPRGIEQKPIPSKNSLFDLPDRDRAELFAWMRDCPYHDAIIEMLGEKGYPGITRDQLDDFFQGESEGHWEYRLLRATQEAGALIRLAEASPIKFSAAILSALGQEAFRQIASGQTSPEAIGKLTTLFLRARSDERADQMGELKREKLRHELDDQLDQAFEKLSEEVDRHPAAREAFDALKRELSTEDR